MDLFRELNKAGSTIILITHDPQLARQASRVVYLNDGRATEASPTAEIATFIHSGQPEPQQSIAP